MDKKVIVTASGLKALEDELEMLKTVRRSEISEKIRVARGYGDLSENSEYDEAKNEQGLVEARIAEIEAMLKNVKVIDESNIATDKVSVGNRVKVYDETFDEELEYTIVGSSEANPVEYKISDESPIGKALVGSTIGEVVRAETPGGETVMKILEISK